MVPRSRDIQIRIIDEDGLTYAVDALVLKHAQALYGLDARVVKRIGVDPGSLPAPVSCSRSTALRA